MKRTAQEFLIVIVGSDERPASPQDIEDIQKVMASVRADPESVIVSHHAIQFEHLYVYEDETLAIFVGNDERPASPQDIEDIQAAFAQLIKDNGLIFVTHHAIRFEKIIKRTLKDDQIRIKLAE